MRLFIYSLFLLCSFHSIIAQDGHEIKVTLDGFDRNVLYLAYHLGDKQYIKDTTYRDPDGTFTFTRKDEKLESGMYMIVIPPENNFMELLMVESEQYFSISASVVDLVGTAKFEGNADDNRLFYEYLNFLNTQRTKAESLNTRKESSTDQLEIKTLTSEQEDLNELVTYYQSRLINDNPNSLTTAIIKASLPLNYSGLEDQSNNSKWRFTQEHWFDNINLKDERLLNTPLLVQKVDYFIDKLYMQRPEIVILATDKVLSLMNTNGEIFKFFLIRFLNKYAKSDIVGMDAVYVHLALNYYAKGLAPWTETAQLNKIVDNANALEPLLIGKTAPNLALQTKDGYTVNLHDLNGEYTVVYFWKSNCENCKKNDPDLETFFQAYKDKGVKISAICTNTNYEAQDCWDYIEKKNYNEWIHLGNPNNDNDIWKAYNVTSTPMIYLLDRDKKILSKRISAKQLSEVMDNILGN